jgi:1-acyl-sn-glycerol-3-phosphate acyltransferase
MQTSDVSALTVPERASLAYRVYKWLVIIPFLGASTTLIGIIITCLSYLGAPDFASRVFGSLWARLNVGVSLVKLKVVGREHLVPHQSYVIIANHQSLFDILLLYGFLELDIKWVMKKELRQLPVLGFACAAMGHILIDRSNTSAALASINQASDRIKNGISVVFFPEGTRSRNANLLPFKKGAFRLAVELQLPILPVTIIGSGDILPTGGLNLRPGTASLTFGAPISTQGHSSDDLTSLIHISRDAMSRQLGQATKEPKTNTEESTTEPA